MVDLQVPKKWMISGASHESFIIHDLDKFFWGGTKKMISSMDLHQQKAISRIARAEKWASENIPAKKSRTRTGWWFQHVSTPLKNISQLG